MSEQAIESLKAYIAEETERIADINNFLESEGIPHARTMLEMCWRVEQLESRLHEHRIKLTALEAQKEAAPACKR